MKKLSFLLLALSLILFSCAQDVSMDQESENSETQVTETVKTGTIKGKAVYSNSDDSSGINIVLEKTDGLQSIAVVQNKTNARSIAANTTTQKDGSFILTDVPEGVYTLYAASQSSTEKAVKTNVVVVDGETIELEKFNLTVIGSISGKITLDNSETDSYGFVVYVASTSYSAMTDRDGSFKITGIPAGPGYSLIISRGSYINYWKTDIEVPALDTITIEPVNFTKEEIESVGRGKNGTSITWLGSFTGPDQISNPKLMDAYFNTTDGCSYIYTESGWSLLAKKGTDGLSGSDGSDGISIIWLGSFASPDLITDPKLMNAYYNTTDGCSYIYTESGWSLLAKKGDKGTTADNCIDDGLYQLHLNFGEGGWTTNKIPVSYTPGEPVELPIIQYERKQFAAWFMDSDFAYQCEDIVYDSEKGRYIFTAPEDAEGVIYLYAGSGTIINSWDEYINYIKGNSSNGKQNVLFFNGLIEVPSENTYIICSDYKICGINNATLDLKTTSTFGYTKADFALCGITVNGNDEHSFKIQYEDYTYDCVIKNCVFKNLNQKNWPWIIGMLLKNPEGKRVIDDCKFIDCSLLSSALCFSGGTSDSLISVSNCSFERVTSYSNNIVGIRNTSEAYMRLDNLRVTDCSFSQNMITTKKLVLAGKIYNSEIVINFDPADKTYPIILDNIEPGYGQTKIITPFTSEDTIETLYIKNKDNSPVTAEQMSALKMLYADKEEINNYPYTKQMLPIKVKFDFTTDFSSYRQAEVTETPRGNFLDIVFPENYKNIRRVFDCGGCDFLDDEYYASLYDPERFNTQEVFDDHLYYFDRNCCDLPINRGTIEIVLFAEDDNGKHYFLNYELIKDSGLYFQYEKKQTMFDFWSYSKDDVLYTITCKEITGIENDPDAEVITFQSTKYEELPYIQLTPGKQYEINVSAGGPISYGNNNHYISLKGSKTITFDYEDTITIELE